MMRLRITVKGTGHRGDDLRLAAEVRRDVYVHSPVEIDPDHPLHGTHRDEHGHAYFEFATRLPEEVHRVLEEYGHSQQVEVTEPHEALGEACQNCSNIAGPELPTVCSNCGFRDISPCPSCQAEIPRSRYRRVNGGTIFRCPNCNRRVRMHFNDTMFLGDGSYNQPLVMVDEVEVRHEVR